MYGLNGLIGIALQDSKTLEEMEMMASGAQMMNPNAATKNYKAMYKAEKDAYDLLDYKFALDDVEEAFLFKFKWISNHTTNFSKWDWKRKLLKLDLKLAFYVKCKHV